MILLLNEKGERIEGFGGVFSEIKLHFAAYKGRPDAVCVVHAHPPYATARGLVGLPLVPMLPEAVVSIGGYIPVAPFAMPGDAVNDQMVVDALKIADVVMLAGNGVLAIGDDLEQAFLRIELLEHIAKIDFYAKTMGHPAALSAGDMSKLLAKRRSIGLGPEARLGLPKSEDPKPDENVPLASRVAPVDPLRETIKNELIRMLANEGRP